jgi:sugar phosphate permease
MSGVQQTFANGDADSMLQPADRSARRYRWSILLAAWMAYLTTICLRLIWTNVSGKAAGSYGLSLEALGVFLTAFYAGYVVSLATTGLLIDRFGARRTLFCALILLGLFTWAFGLTTSLTGGLFFQALMGLAAGTDYAAGAKLIVTWFDREERGRAMGLYMTATSLGVVVCNAVVPQALKFVTWPTIYLGAGIFTAMLGVLCYLTIRDNPVRIQTPRLNWQDVRGLMRNRQYLLMVLAGTGAVWGTWGYAIWASALMTRGLHFSPVVAGGIVAVSGGAAVAGKPAIGWLSDQLGGRRKILVVINLFVFAALLLLAGALHTEHEFWMLAPFLGLAAFVYSPLINAMTAEAGSTAAATAAGVSIAVPSIGTMIVPLVVGYGFNATHSYETAFSILALGPLIGGFLMLAVRETRNV